MGFVKAENPVEGATQGDDSVERMFRKAMAMKDELGLSEWDRHELALKVSDSQSWKALNRAQLTRLLDMLSGMEWYVGVKL